MSGMLVALIELNLELIVPKHLPGCNNAAPAARVILVLIIVPFIYRTEFNSAY